MNLLRDGAKYSVNMPSGIVTKPPKPGFVGFGITYLGDYQEFFSVLLGEAAFIEGVIFHRSALVAAMVCKGGAMPSITWAWAWAWGRDDQRPVFTAYRSLDGGI
jgi:hypothetical protein